MSQQVRIYRMLDLSPAALTPHSTQGTYPVMRLGDRITERTLVMTAAASQHLDPVQFNLNIAGTAPTSSSTINMTHQLITHDTTDMATLRLKCADWNISVGKNVSDVYVYQGELDFIATSTITAGHEACVMGLQVNASAGTITGDVCGVRIVMAGASLPATTSIGVDISSRTSATLTHGLYFYIQSAATMTNAVYVENAGTLTNFLKFSAVIAGVASATAEAPLTDIQSVASQGFIRVLVGSTVRYIALYGTTS